MITRKNKYVEFFISVKKNQAVKAQAVNLKLIIIVLQPGGSARASEGS